jgi:hypothetical protein
MTTSADIKYRKSVQQTDIATNGGRMGTVRIISGARHALFPRVTKSQRALGLQRWRKAFWCNENADDESAYGALVFLYRPTNADDRVYLAKGTQRDVQSEFNRDDYPYGRVWMGAGALETALLGGESEVELAMEDDDYQFPQGGYLYLSNNTQVSQTIDAGVKIGDSVAYSSGSWSKIPADADITYPKGWCVGENEVLTIDGDTHEEFLKIADNQYEDEVIGAGDGSDTDPELDTLLHPTNGICRQPDWLPVVKATCGGVERTVNVAADGSCSGYCSAGALNMATGVWTTDIVWTTAPDNGTDITITYAENAWSWSGNVATVELDDTVANAYSADNTTFGAGCVHEDEVACSFDNWVETSSAGTYDEDTYPLDLYNDGTVEETWTLTFSSGSAFTVTGAHYGSLGAGNITGDFEPLNPVTGQPYFTLASAGWGGTWANGDTVVFQTHPATVPLLLENFVPAGTEVEPNNLLPIGSYTE